MLSRKIKIIILGIAVLLSAVLVYAFIGKNKTVENIPKEDTSSVNLSEELKNIHPEFSAAQLEFYRQTAQKDSEIVIPCEGRNDVNDCIASVAFLKNRTDICGEIADLKIKTECAKTILQTLGAEKVKSCQLLQGDSLISCLSDVFATYNKPGDCLDLTLEKTKQACEDIFYYKAAFIQRDLEVCKKIIDAKMNQYCVDNINAIDKSLDSDNDGLTDYEEKNIYHTDPKNPDTDRDGYSDGEEVKHGHNPLGGG